MRQTQRDEEAIETVYTHTLLLVQTKRLLRYNNTVIH